jgi:versiconal hemiacetal acetate esterase
MEAKGWIEIYGAPIGDKYASPLLHPKIAELPKTYVSYCGHDTLADDARLMIEAMQKAGVEVKYDEFKGYPHYFWTFPAPQLAEPTRDYLEKVVNGIKFVTS